MGKFAGRSGDKIWGRNEYFVTKTQKATLEGLEYLLSSLPRALGNTNPHLWQAGFISQNPKTGAVILGLNHASVTVYRTGRLESNAPYGALLGRR